MSRSALATFFSLVPSEEGDEDWGGRALTVTLKNSVSPASELSSVECVIPQFIFLHQTARPFLLDSCSEIGELHLSASYFTRTFLLFF